MGKKKNKRRGSRRTKRRRRRKIRRESENKNVMRSGFLQTGRLHGEQV